MRRRPRGRVGRIRRRPAPGRGGEAGPPGRRPLSAPRPAVGSGPGPMRRPPTGPTGPRPLRSSARPRRPRRRTDRPRDRTCRSGRGPRARSSTCADIAEASSRTASACSGVASGGRPSGETADAHDPRHALSRSSADASWAPAASSWRRVWPIDWTSSSRRDAARSSRCATVSARSRSGPRASPAGRSGGSSKGARARAIASRCDDERARRSSRSTRSARASSAFWSTASRDWSQPRISRGESGSIPIGRQRSRQRAWTSEARSSA